jgi:HSP20 family protein
MLAKWNPFADETFSPFISPTFNGDAAQSRPWATQVTYLPAADVLETQDELKVRLDMPGHDPKSLQVRLANDTLFIRSERTQNPEERNASYLRSERAQGAFERSFVLPRSVDAAKCEAKYENGVLTLTLPKREESKPRSIAIKVAS